MINMKNQQTIWF